MKVLALIIALMASEPISNADLVIYDSTKQIDRYDLPNGHYSRNDPTSGHWFALFPYVYSNPDEARNHLPAMPARCKREAVHCISAMLIADGKDGAVYHPVWTEASFTICVVMKPTEYRVKCTDNDALRVVTYTPRVDCDPTGKCVPSIYTLFFPHWRPGEAPSY